MGVVEAGMIAGFTAAGIPQAEAVAATFTARMFTTYLHADLGLGGLPVAPPPRLRLERHLQSKT